MKNAVCIFGSPDGNGGAARLFSETSRGMADAGISVQSFFLGECDIGFCRGCNGCGSDGVCVQQDDMDRIIAAMLQADFVCAGDVCGFGGVSALLNAFFERTRPLIATPGKARFPSGKAGIIMAVNPGCSATESTGTMDAIERWFTSLGIRATGGLRYEGIGTLQDMADRQDELRYAYEAGLHIPEYSNARRAAFGLAVATERDAPVIAQMSAELLNENALECAETRVIEKKVRRWLNSEYTGLLVWVNGKIAGYFLYRPDVDRNGKDSRRIEQYYIRPAYRYRGLKNAVLRVIIDICFRTVEHLSVTSFASDPIGRMFWEKSACRQESIEFSKPIPVFSDENPLTIIGWGKKEEEIRGRRPRSSSRLIRTR